MLDATDIDSVIYFVCACVYMDACFGGVSA